MNLALAQTKDLFDALSDRLRLRLACCLLSVEAGLCVCELVEALQVSQPNASRHLKLMKAANLVEEERDGRWVYYRLKDAENPLFKNIRGCIETVCCCADIQEDLRRLRLRLKLRRDGRCVVGFRR